MSRRAKILMALGAFAACALIIWLVLSSTPPGVALRFARYETNYYADATYGGNPRGQLVFAVFELTNSTKRTLACVVNSGTATWQMAAAMTVTNVAAYRGRGGTISWTPTTGGTRNVITPGPSGTLDPGRSARIFMAVKDFQQPMRAYVEYREIPASHRFMDRLPRWLRLPQWQRSVSVTIQEP